MESHRKVIIIHLEKKRQNNALIFIHHNVGKYFKTQTYKLTQNPHRGAKGRQVEHPFLVLVLLRLLAK